VTVKPITDDVALQVGEETSQQLHCVELSTFAALIDHAPAFRANAETLEDDWLVMPLPDVDEAMVPLPTTPWINGPPGVVTFDVPPRGGRGHVSPAVLVELEPLVVMVDIMPVARPLNS
jgi:hypothetical protein